MIRSRRSKQVGIEHRCIADPCEPCVIFRRFLCFFLRRGLRPPLFRGSQQFQQFRIVDNFGALRIRTPLGDRFKRFSSFVGVDKKALAGFRRKFERNDAAAVAGFFILLDRELNPGGHRFFGGRSIDEFSQGDRRLERGVLRFSLIGRRRRREVAHHRREAQLAKQRP